MKCHKNNNSFLTIKFPLPVKHKAGGVFVYKEKSQMRRLIDAYIATVAIVTAATLVMTGVAISKINTDYMQTGERAGRIVAERENAQISLTTHEGITIAPEGDYLAVADKILTFLPPPVNTTYLMIKEVVSAVREGK